MAVSYTHLNLDYINESDAIIKDENGFERCEILEEFADLSEAERLCISLHLSLIHIS